VCDAQSGHEKTLTGLLAALAGANIIYGLGMIESGVTFDFGQVVMDNEIARMIKYAVKGIPVNDETLSVDITKEVGPFSDFLSHENTYKYMRTQSLPQLMDRRVREDWQLDGSKDLHQRALEKARNIMETHHPDPLPDVVLKRMRAIVDETEEELGLKKTG
jgi:trimethylamine--corrinoid protein Co-methyltransferase